MKHTAQYMSPAIGQEIFVSMESLMIPCKVLDVKSSWGKIRLLVTPVRGEGEQWIEVERIKKVLETIYSKEMPPRCNYFSEDGERRIKQC